MAVAALPNHCSHDPIRVRVKIEGREVRKKLLGRTREIKSNETILLPLFFPRVSENLKSIVKRSRNAFQDSPSIGSGRNTRTFAKIVISFYIFTRNTFTIFGTRQYEKQ